MKEPTKHEGQLELHPKNDSPNTDPNKHWIPTNEENLTEMLTGGLLKPYPMYAKYYDDILMKCPGRIPLFSGGVTKKYCPSPEDPNDPAPVLIELKEEAKRFADPSKSVSFVDHPLPASMIEKIHFKDREKLEHWKSRPLDNFDPSPYTFEVNPSLFEKTSEQQEKAFDEGCVKQDDQKNKWESHYGYADAMAGVLAAHYNKRNISRKSHNDLLDKLNNIQYPIVAKDGPWKQENHGSESKLISHIYSALIKNEPKQLGEETINNLKELIEKADYKKDERDAIFERLDGIRKIITQDGSIGEFFKGYKKSAAIRAFLLLLNYKEESEITKNDFPQEWKITWDEQFLALCFRNAWRGWRLLNGAQYKTLPEFIDLIGRWMCNLLADKTVFDLPTGFLKRVWVKDFWNEVDFRSNKAAEDFALKCAAEYDWKKCGIKQTIAIPAQKWYFKNYLSWKNEFKIEVRDDVAEIKLEYDGKKLRTSISDHDFTGKKLEDAFALLP